VRAQRRHCRWRGAQLVGHCLFLLLTRPSRTIFHCQVEGGGARAFGPALEALLSYLGATDADTAAPRFPAVRLLSFLSGAPNAGIGALDNARWHAAQSALFPVGAAGNAGEEAAAAASDSLAAPQSSFYAEAATRAAAAGIVVDLFAVPPPGGASCLDLASLEPLPRLSCGVLAFYEHGPGDAPLPRDLHRILSQPTALHGTLRVRTCPELRVARAYGHCYEDRAHDALYHIIACGQHDTVAFDFEYATSEGFGAPSTVDQPPAVQVAFEYTILLPVVVSDVAEPEDEAPDAPAPPSEPSSFVRQRRRRIMTAPAKLARTRRQMFESCDADATTVLLTHKAIRAASSEGILEARLMLTDWLAVLAARCSGAYAQPGSISTTADASFACCPALQPLPRLVYGLLSGPLLGALHVHPDARAFTASLATALEPLALSRVLYPKMVPWEDVDTVGGGTLSLARAAMAATGAPIYLLDALKTVLVYYAAVPPGAPQQPMPPPQKSALRAALNELRDSRALTPRVLFVQGGRDDASVLEALLLDDGGVAEDSSLGAFVEAVGLAARDTATE